MDYVHDVYLSYKPHAISAHIKTTNHHTLVITNNKVSYVRVTPTIHFLIHSTLYQTSSLSANISGYTTRKLTLNGVELSLSAFSSLAWILSSENS